MPQLTCQDLTLGYEGKPVVSGLSFTVSAGDYLCIVGENGSGKTTLMKTLLRLKTPISGKIVMGDGLKPNDIGYLPQQTAAQKDFPASVREVVLSGCLNRRGWRPYYNRAEKRRAEMQMERLGILGLSRRCYRELSGGQQQRVLLARALCAAGKILLLDEPAAGLDPASTADMYKIIQALNAGGVTVMMISHDIPSALAYASHILHIGSPLVFGTVSEYAARLSGGEGGTAE
ncbi:MAG: ABC transporter ATP-binding protein [Oscillospiraceae bacterium]|jgi:zinc transport system ATP-binding protein|nr:ABC transporter ATP-binding protein [Oscillospiraceae bacterium]